MAFHPYPRVIPSVFNRSGFGPPRGLTPASACPWIAHPASRPRRATERPVQTRFRCGSVFLNLAARRDSQAHSTKGTPSRNDCPLRLLVGARFQVLFHSPLGVLFTFPSRYWFAIGHRRVFSLGGWSPLLRAGFHVSGATRAPHRAGGGGSRTGPSPCLAGLSGPFRFLSPLSPRPGLRSPGRCGPTTPASQRLRAVTRTRVWAGCAFARRYSRNLV